MGEWICIMRLQCLLNRLGVVWVKPEKIFTPQHQSVQAFGLNKEGRRLVNLYVQDVQFHSNPVLILCVHLDAVDMTEISQKCHQVGFGVDHMTDSILRPHQQCHLCVLFALL